MKSRRRIFLLINVPVRKLWLIHSYIWDKTLVNFKTILDFQLGLSIHIFNFKQQLIFLESYYMYIYIGFTCYTRIKYTVLNYIIHSENFSFGIDKIHPLPFHGTRGRKWNTAFASVFAYPCLYLFKHTGRIQAEVTWLQCY